MPLRARAPRRPPCPAAQRLKWQPDQPVLIAVIRVYRLGWPQQLAVSPRYAGCKSWVELDTPVASGTVRPVLDDAAFAARAGEIMKLLEG